MTPGYMIYIFLFFTLMNKLSDSCRIIPGFEKKIFSKITVVIDCATLGSLLIYGGIYLKILNQHDKFCVFLAILVPGYSGAITECNVFLKFF